MLDSVGSGYEGPRKWDRMKTTLLPAAKVILRLGNYERVCQTRLWRELSGNDVRSSQRREAATTDSIVDDDDAARAAYHLGDKTPTDHRVEHTAIATYLSVVEITERS
ncbi:hypothetical protein P691DRAFT_786756 [Macrolepiota fuliginosa MF-IS2]|uniref:Uncharacterized protein n=1 Tax=Macrolepiota fuliginosa MF-IS2 TaxID=1400762 RepID=A0A9P5XL71_9AGAR|nr:hypothetical protein P691DRAFT_786756 [Macrolepiota fuliginosa MF-IS2]